ncbi:MAG: alpha/beta fold hydrolase, partial [Candidatus Eremiobacterota bacterium]
MKLWRRRLALGALAGIGLWLAVCGATCWLLVHRKQGPFPEDPPEAHWLPVELSTADGLRVGAWYVPGEPMVLLLHGNGSSRSSETSLIRELERRGYGVLAPSLRAHGDSDGSLNDFGCSARLDVIACVDALEARGHRCTVFGRSLGASAALFAAP